MIEYLGKQAYNNMIVQFIDMLEKPSVIIVSMDQFHIFQKKYDSEVQIIQDNDNSQFYLAGLTFKTTDIVEGLHKDDIDTFNRLVQNNTSVLILTPLTIDEVYLMEEKGIEEMQKEQETYRSFQV